MCQHQTDVNAKRKGGTKIKFSCYTGQLLIYKTITNVNNCPFECLTKDCPFFGITLSTIIVVPPANAARVPAEKSSANGKLSSSVKNTTFFKPIYFDLFRI
jgi:hypothetical protein